MKQQFLTLSLLVVGISLGAMEDSTGTVPFTSLTPAVPTKQKTKEYRQRKNQLWQATGLTPADKSNPHIQRLWNLIKTLERQELDMPIPYGYFPGDSKEEQKAARGTLVALLAQPLDTFGVGSASSASSSSGTSSGTSSDSSSDCISD